MGGGGGLGPLPWIRHWHFPKGIKLIKEEERRLCANHVKSMKSPKPERLGLVSLVFSRQTGCSCVFVWLVGHPDPDILRGGLQKIKVRPFGPQFGLTIKEGGGWGGPWAPALDSPLAFP